VKSEVSVLGRVSESAKPIRIAGGAADYISFVEIRNFKAIDWLSFSFPEGDGERAPWKMLLGENGTGKSTVLEALALVLMGSDVHEKKFVKQGRETVWPKDVIRRRRPGEKKSRSYIRVRFARDSKLHELRITKRRFYFADGPPTTSLFVRGYGATRIPGTDEDESERSKRIAIKVANLFDPFVPLVDADHWLRDLRGAETTDPTSNAAWNAAAKAIADLLDRAEALSQQLAGIIDDIDREDMYPDFLVLEAGRILLEGDRLDWLSAGYRSVLAMVCDIMAGNPASVSDMRSVQGIILLDEIGAHLHPAWKMRIVSGLREAFPGMQFIATTHEPLCLRGLRDGECALMTRDLKGDRTVHLNERLPDPKTLRIDQLLTSRYFGLNSTVDPDKEKNFVEYYELLATRRADPEGELGRFTDEKSARLDELEEALREHRIGHTRREQVMYEIIDEWLASQKARKASEPPPKIPEETRRRVLDLWKMSGLKRRLTPRSS